MKIQKTLTKENFFNEMMEKYPKAMKMFCTWIDEYKESVNWNKLFNDSYSRTNIQRASNGEICNIDVSAPKFHDIPYDMQVGIWINFAEDTLDHLFEQPEYSYSGDLEEDIKTVFKEIEEFVL
jgi:hypothetical protein